MSRQQLPPQIKKLSVKDRAAGKPVVSYQVTVDVGVHPKTGKRQQAKRRFPTEKAARTALAELQSARVAGDFVARSNATVGEVFQEYVLGRRGLRESSRSKLQYDLAPVVERHGELAIQRLSKSHIDGLVNDLVAGGTKTGKGRTRKPWSPSSVNKMIATVEQVLEDAKKQGFVPRNVAALVDRVPMGDEEIDTYTEHEVRVILAAIADDRLSHAWELALSGLRRGEVAGLRWADVDLDEATLVVRTNRVSAGGRTVENAPKTAASRRTLPLPDRLVSVLRSAKARQAAERLALGGGAFEYVASNEMGQPYSPPVLSRYWRDRVQAAGVRHIKLHGARHTCATLMHFQQVPAAVIAAWVGHKDATLTMKMYVHSQNEALKAAGATLNRTALSRDMA